MSSSSSAAQPPRVVRGGGLKLKGGIVIRAAPPPSVAPTAAATAVKRKQHPDAEGDSSSFTAASEPVKPEPRTAATSPPSPPPSQSASPADDSLPSEAPSYVKRTRREDDVEAVNAALQRLSRTAERADRRHLIAADRQRAAQQLAGAEAQTRDADAVRLVDASRAYVKHGFGDEAAMPATRRLNEREKKKSDRYCK